MDASSLDRAARGDRVASGTEADSPPSWLVLLLAVACGLIVANVYYAQPLIGLIGHSIGLSPGAAGLVVTLTQVGYGIGLLFIVPIADLLENRGLALVILAVLVVALLGAAAAGSATVFLLAALFIGVSSVSVQVLVPLAAHLAPEHARGRVVGNVMSGLMLGIMGARPAASLIANALSWHAVFIISAGLMVAVAAVLRGALPRFRPADTLSYGALVGSMWRLVRTTPVLRRRSFYHACLFGAFSVFWTTVPLLLTDHFHLTQNGIALFSLAGVAGAISAPLAGRAADRGWSLAASAAAMVAVAAACGLAMMSAEGGSEQLGALVFAALLLDFGVTANFVTGQRAIFMLPGEIRGRLNGLYIAAFFFSGSACSTLGTWTYSVGGWTLSMWAGIALAAVALAALCYVEAFGQVSESR